MRLTRRAALGAGAAVAAVGATGALVEYDVLPGRTRAHELLGLNGEDGTVPEVAAGPVDFGVLESAHVAEPPTWGVVYPPGSSPGDTLPLVVVLHYAGSSARGVIDTLGLPQFLAASGARMALAVVDGGRSYWQAQPDGDSGRMVTDELLPFLAGRGLQADRPAWLGWSMGGYGVLRLTAQRAADGVADGPVLAVSPALWADQDDRAEGAFLSVKQYDAAMALLVEPRATPTRVDCGTGDPFYRDVRELTVRADIDTRFEPGDHTAGYWRRVLPDQLAWLAAGLPGTAE